MDGNAKMSLLVPTLCKQTDFVFFYIYNDGRVWIFSFLWKRVCMAEKYILKIHFNAPR